MATVGVKGLKSKNPHNSVTNWQTLLTMTRQCQTETGEVRWLPIICDCRPVAGVADLLDIRHSTVPDFLERRGIIMLGVTDRSSKLQSTATSQ